MQWDSKGALAPELRAHKDTSEIGEPQSYGR